MTNSAYRSPRLLSFLGMYTALTYIDVASAGLPGVPATVTLSMLNANVSSFVGRYANGAMGWPDEWSFTAVTGVFGLTRGQCIHWWPLLLYMGECSGWFCVSFGIRFAVVDDMEFGDTGDMGRLFMAILVLVALGGGPGGTLNTATGW